jgi:putative transposase
LLTVPAPRIISWDSLTVDTITLTRIYLLIFVEHGTCRADVAGTRTHPNGPWVTPAAGNLAMDLGERLETLRFLSRDRDRKFPAAFDAVFTADGIERLLTPSIAPRADAIREPIVGTRAENASTGH